jgi:hypothetical protein
VGDSLLVSALLASCAGGIGRVVTTWVTALEKNFSSRYSVFSTHSNADH